MSQSRRPARRSPVPQPGAAVARLPAHRRFSDSAGRPGAVLQKRPVWKGNHLPGGSAAVAVAVAVPARWRR